MVLYRLLSVLSDDYKMLTCLIGADNVISFISEMTLLFLFLFIFRNGKEEHTADRGTPGTPNN